MKRTWIVENDSIYRTSFALKVGGTKRQALEWYYRKIGVEPNAEHLRVAEGSRAKASFVGRTGYLGFVIWLRDVPEGPTPEVAGIIAHEALHATFHVMHALGVERITEESEESFTYYADYLVREIYRRLWPAAKPQEKPAQ